MPLRAGVLFPKPMIRVQIVQLDMLRLSDQLEMLDVYAARVFAAVMKNSPLGNLPVGLLVPRPVDVNEDPILPHHGTAIALSMMAVPTLTRPYQPYFVAHTGPIPLNLHSLFNTALHAQHIPVSCP